MIEQIGTLLGALLAGGVVVWSGWRKVAPILPRLEEFLKDWAGNPGADGPGGVIERLCQLEKSIPVLSGAVDRLSRDLSCIYVELRASSKIVVEVEPQHTEPEVTSP